MWTVIDHLSALAALVASGLVVLGLVFRRPFRVVHALVYELRFVRIALEILAERVGIPVRELRKATEERIEALVGKGKGQ